ncbi:MAG: hypothetical protein D6731_23120 [Planctomycetota bacterium]|nr:MAG: hypothetical protein D6731_23120 [Planctomycetota bacterium]
MTPSRPLALLGLALAACGSGCAAPRHSIADLGFPAFSEHLGTEARYTLAAEDQRGSLDAYPPQADDDADHRYVLSFLPAGSEERVGIEVRAHVKGKLGFRRLLAAAYPVSNREAGRFAQGGSLPQGRSPLAISSESREDEAGWRILHLVLPRDRLPADCEALAVPTLAEFKDGWISVRFYTTRVPEPIKLLSAEELEALRRRVGGATPASQAENPASPRSSAGRRP